MSKNAFVLVDHFGDNGTVTEGMILHDLTTKRFDELEKRELVREATAEEVEAGYQPPFVAEADREVTETVAFSADTAEAAAALETIRREVVEAAQKGIDELRAALDEVTKRAEGLQEKADAADALKDRAEAAEKKVTAMEADLKKANEEIADLKAAAKKPAKAAQEPANKQAADPANKGA